jgi:NAD(P)H-flavin reductase
MSDVIFNGKILRILKKDDKNFVEFAVEVGKYCKVLVKEMPSEHEFNPGQFVEVLVDQNDGIFISNKSYMNPEDVDLSFLDM